MGRLFAILNGLLWRIQDALLRAGEQVEQRSAAWHEWDDARCDAEEREALVGGDLAERLARVKAALDALDEELRKERNG